MTDDEVAAFAQRGVLTVVPRSASGRSLHGEPAELLRHPVEEFLPEPATIDRVAEAFTREGLAVEARTDVGLTVSGEQSLLAEVFGSAVAVVRNKYIRDSPRYELVAEGPLRSRVCPDLIAAVSAPRSGFELTVAQSPPAVVAGHHLSLPNDAVRVAGAERLHAAGIRGDGVRVVMVDTGLYDHPHHRQHGYQTSVVAALPQLDPTADERGHGTAMSALLLAVAPRVSLTMVKMANECFSFPIAAFQQAVRLEPDIISCSWGTLREEPHLHLEVANAIRRGITVLFAAGNGSTDRRTAMFQSVATPGAITVGGVHVGPDGELRAADLASSYRSAVFPGRAVPDVSGPCGMLPNGNYILFPTQPGCMFDRRNSAYDGTAPDDGWLVSSGTSGATAYAAGVVALGIQQGLGSGADSLAARCVPVTQGRSITGDDCGGVSPNPATGHGLLTAGPTSGPQTAEIRQQHVVRFVGGRGLAALADQFLLFAIPLLVYKTTGSVAASGLVFLIEWLPRVLFVPVAGVLADRVDGYRLYLGADGIRALLAVGAFLAIQAWPGATVVTLSILAASMSLASAQAYIAMETTLPRFVPPEHMVRAQATIQGTEQASTVLGPAFAVLLSAVLGTVDLLLAIGALFTLTAINMFTLRTSLRKAVTNAEPTTVRGVLAAVVAGAHTLFKLPAIVGLVGLTMMVNLMVGVGMATSAAITTGTFGKSDRYFGVLSFAEGVLSLLVFFVIPRLSRRISPLVAILGTFVIICLGGLTISQASTFTQFVIGYVLLIGTVGMLNVFIRAERIRRIPREHLGKTIGLIVLLNQVSLPISGLVVATFANAHGPQAVVFGSVLGSVLIAVLLLPLVLQLRYR